MKTFLVYFPARQVVEYSALPEIPNRHREESATLREFKTDNFPDHCGVVYGYIENRNPEFAREGSRQYYGWGYVR